MPIVALLPLFTILAVGGPLFVPVVGRALSAVGLIAPGLVRWGDPQRSPERWLPLWALLRTSWWFRWAARNGFITGDATSGYRSPSLNASLPNSAKNSFHLRGLAFDATPTRGARETAYVMRDRARNTFFLWRPPLEEVGWYAGTGHVHVSVAPWWTVPAFEVFRGD